MSFTREFKGGDFLNLTILLSDTFTENEWAFDLLYCVAFVVMDKLWLERNATYMEFNVSIRCVLVGYSS